MGPKSRPVLLTVVGEEVTSIAKPRRRSPRRLRLRRLAVLSAGLAIGVSLGEAVPVGATVQVNPPQASCYSFYYWDALDSNYENSLCGSAGSAAGYSAEALVNVDAQYAHQHGVNDAVYFSAGHSLDLCTGSNCTGAAMLFEQPNGGTLSALVGDASYTAEMGGPFLSTVCDDTNNCHSQSATAGQAYSWGTAAELDEMNLAVIEACVTANNGAGTSIALAAYNAGAGTATGFTQNISFATGTDNLDKWGYAWGHRFWNDLQNGSSYSGSMLDATSYENAQSGGYFGYDSAYMYHAAGAPNSLRPAQYWYLVGCYACL